MIISQIDFERLYELCLTKKSIYIFDTDFACAGELSSILHSKKIYKCLLKSMYDIQNPIIIMDRNSASYFICNGLMSGLFGQIDKITKVGELLENNNKYVVHSSNSNYCQSCGSPLKNDICEYCGSTIKVSFGNIPIYAVPDSINYKNNIMVVSYDLQNANLINLKNLDYI